MPRAATISSSPKNQSIAYALCVIALGAAALGLVLAYGIDGLSRQARQAGISVEGGTVIERSMSAHRLTIPADWFRFEEQKTDGFAERLDLQLPMTIAGKDTPTSVQVTLVPRSRVRPSAQMIDTVYLHQFLPGQLAGPPGLIGKPLASSEGYQNETVWYDPLSARPFAAKCLAALETERNATCLRTVAIDPYLAAIITFDETMLAHWREMDKAMADPLSRIGLTYPPQ